MNINRSHWCGFFFHIVMPSPFSITWINSRYLYTSHGGNVILTILHLFVSPYAHVKIFNNCALTDGGFVFFALLLSCIGSDDVTVIRSKYAKSKEKRHIIITTYSCGFEEGQQQQQQQNMSYFYNFFSSTRAFSGFSKCLNTLQWAKEIMFIRYLFLFVCLLHIAHIVFSFFSLLVLFSAISSTNVFIWSRVPI